MGDCIPHNVCKDKHGYGSINRKGFECLAHRQAWVDVYGPIPKGKVIRHKCDNPECISIDHLEIGTQADNIRDRDVRGRTAKGMKNGRAKMTPEMVEYVTTSVASSRVLGEQLGVSHTAIQWARRGQTHLSKLIK